ncbi:major facilitator superfamily MFS_1, partial [mine drainage metagenome]
MRDHLRIFTATAIGHFANDGTFLLFPLFIVYYMKVPGVSLSILGTMAILYQLLSALVSPKIGKYADRYGKIGRLMSLGIALEATSILIFGIAFILHSSYIYIVIAAGAVLLGLGQAFYHPIGGALLTMAFKNKAPKYMGINGSMGSIGRTLMPAVVTAFVAVLGMSVGVSLFSLIFFGLAAAIFISLNIGKPYRMLAVQSPNHAIRKERSSKATRLGASVYKLTASLFFKSAFLTGTVTFIGAYMYLVYSASAAIVGIFLSVTFLPAILGQYAFGILTERYGNRSMFSLTTILMVLFFLLFLLSNNIYVASLLYSSLCTRRFYSVSDIYELFIKT